MTHTASSAAARLSSVGYGIVRWRKGQRGGQTVFLFPDGLQTEPRRTQHKGQRKGRSHQSGIGHGLQQMVMGVFGLILEGLHGAGHVFRRTQSPTEERRCGENFPRVLIKGEAVAFQQAVPEQP